MTSHGLPVSSTTTSGIIQIATQDQVNTGTDNTTAVTPATLAVRMQRPAATTTVAGITRYATDAEALAGTVTTAAIVPETLNYVFNNKAASETASGTIKLTTDSQAKAGTDDTTAATPLRVKQMIALFSPTQVSYQPAANSVLGVVNIATSQQVSAGTLDTGYAISPKALMGTKASQTQYGVIRTATSAEVNAGTDSTLAVSPSTLAALTSTSARLGLVKLVTSNTSDSTSAASATNAVFNTRRINGHQLNADVTISSSDVGAYSKSESDSRFMPINQSVGGLGGGTYIGVNSSVFYTTVNYTSKANINISVFFDVNDDGTTTRQFTYGIYINGALNQQNTISLLDTKGGNKGHSWRFQSYGVMNNHLEGLSPNSTIEIRPLNNYLALNYSYSIVNL